jgi:hypothetical protein
VTEGRRPGDRPWGPGVSGNPKGRPKGLRPKVNEAFLKDMLDSWEKHGKDAIERMVEKYPARYVQVMAALMDKHLHITTELDLVRNLSDEEIYERLARLRPAIEQGRIPALPGTPEKTETSEVVPLLSRNRSFT